MKTKLYMIALLSVATMSAFAQNFTPAQLDRQAMQSQQIIQTGAYNGTVYEPFSNTTPSEQNAPGASYSPAKAPGGPRKGFDVGGETGRADEYPIGDAVLPMLVCAALFCGVIALRRKRSAENAAR